MRLIVAALAAGVLSGCAVSPQAQGPTADGSFTITRTGDTFYAQPAQLTELATRDAQAHCAGMGRTFQPVASTTTGTRPGQAPQGQVVYRCE